MIIVVDEGMYIRTTGSSDIYARVVFVQAIKVDGRICPHITTHPQREREGPQGERSTGTFGYNRISLKIGRWIAREGCNWNGAMKGGPPLFG